MDYQRIVFDGLSVAEFYIIRLMFNDTSQGVRNFGVGEEVISTDMISFIVGGIRKEARIRRRFRSSEFLIWEAERI